MKMVNGPRSSDGQTEKWDSGMSQRIRMREAGEPRVLWKELGEARKPEELLVNSHFNCKIWFTTR